MASGNLVCNSANINMSQLPISNERVHRETKKRKLGDTFFSKMAEPFLHSFIESKRSLRKKRQKERASEKPETRLYSLLASSNVQKVEHIPSKVLWDLIAFCRCNEFPLIFASSCDPLLDSKNFINKKNSGLMAYRKHMIQVLSTFNIPAYGIPILKETSNALYLPYNPSEDHQSTALGIIAKSWEEGYKKRCKGCHSGEWTCICSSKCDCSCGCRCECFFVAKCVHCLCFCTSCDKPPILETFLLEVDIALILKRFRLIKRLLDNDEMDLQLLLLIGSIKDQPYFDPVAAEIRRSWQTIKQYLAEQLPQIEMTFKNADFSSGTIIYCISKDSVKSISETEFSKIRELPNYVPRDHPNYPRLFAKFSELSPEISSSASSLDTPTVDGDSSDFAPRATAKKERRQLYDQKRRTQTPWDRRREERAKSLARRNRSSSVS